MFFTYPESLIPNAMENLGDMYAYAVKRWYYTIDEFQNLFLSSGTAEAFECGDPELICGFSGAELANYVLWSAKLPQRKLEHGFDFTGVPEFLAGQAVALYQRRAGWSFQEIHNILPMSRIVEVVTPPEMDEHTLFTVVWNEICKIVDPESWEMLQEEEERRRKLRERMRKE